MEQLLALGVTGLIELPPAGTLVGLAKRGLRGVETLALTSPEDLDKAREMIATHAGTAALDTATDTATDAPAGRDPAMTTPDTGAGEAPASARP